MSVWSTADKLQRLSIWPLGAGFAAVFLDGLFNINFPSAELPVLSSVELDELVLGLSLVAFVGSAFVMNHVVAGDNPDMPYFYYLPEQFRFWN